MTTKFRSEPEWLKYESQTPLHIRLHGKYYSHAIHCSGDRRFPIGTPGHCCCCLRSLKK